MYQPHIVIVGAGIVGLSTAYALLKQGIEHVTILEQATVDHARSTSRGPSRLLRFEYGKDAFYSEMVRLSLQRWKELECATKRTLYTQTGLLVLGDEDDNFTLPSYHVLRELGIATQRLSQRACMQRFPQFHTQPYSAFTYNRTAGILHASTCLHVLKQLILDLGGKLCEASRVTRIITGDQPRPLQLVLRSGEEYTADRVVLATGPWVHSLLGELQLPVHLTRQYLLYFADLPASSFCRHSFPAFIAPSVHGGDLYGFPLHNSSTSHDSGWFKAASHIFGEPVDPAEVPTIDEHVISQVRKQLYELVPALQDATLIHVDACMYDVSDDGNFILDSTPADARVVFASGLTGHGFKFGPLLGELLASMVCETEPPISLQHFRMTRFAQPSLQSTIAVA